MTKVEVLKLLNKIKVYYPMFSLEDYVKEEWINKLKDYDNDDVLEKFEKHLEGEYSATEPPKLHFLTKFLKTHEQKEKASTDFLICCDLCGEEMYLSTYDNEHHDKCLLIKSLISLLKKRGEIVSYEELDQYPIETLNKIWDKYMPLNKELNL
jgi:hypothetical protein